MMNLLILTCQVAEPNKQWLQPAVIAAIIAALVTVPSIILSFQNMKAQRLKSERDEIYKKLNSFYGPIRLQLKNSRTLYDIFSQSIIRRTGNQNFRTIPFILDEQEFNKTEKTLLEQILSIGEKIEQIIDENAGLIDSDDIHNEMIKLSVHLKIIRAAYSGEYETGDKKEILLEQKTFPDIINSIDATFKKLKSRLDKLNKKK